MEGSLVEAYTHIQVLTGMELEVLPLVRDVDGVGKANYIEGGGLLTNGIMAEISGKDIENVSDTVLEIRRIRGVQNTYTMPVNKAYERLLNTS